MIAWPEFVQYTIVKMNESEHEGFVVAVSGGVDSVVLLDVLAKQYAGHLTVAHFDHGIREDSQQDRILVQDLARKYGLPFVFKEGQLGAKASEAAAREARYTFLRRVQQTSGASAIATAHHEDDLLETAIVNLLRGTGRKGLSSLQSTNEIYRPLLGTPKQNIIAYAQRHNLQWREDSTNSDQKYLRNYVRHRLLTRFDTDARQQLRALLDNARLTNMELDDLLAKQLKLQPETDELDRKWFINLPHEVSREVLAAWLRAQSISDFNHKAIERIVAQAKTLAPGKQIDIDATHIIMVKRGVLALAPRDR